MRKMLKNINSFRSLFLILVAVATQPTISNAQEQAQYSLVGVNEFEASSLLQYAAHAALDQGDISGENIARIVEQLYHEDGYFLARTRFDSDL